MYCAQITMDALIQRGLTGTMTTPQVLVLGGTGRTGRRIVDCLRRKDVAVRVASRRSIHPAGHVFDWDDPGTWDGALRGATAAYVCYSPDLAFAGVSDLVAEFAEAARAQGVGHLVLLSGRGEDGAIASERAVQESADSWAIVRSSWFSQNFSENFLLGPVQRGRLVLPAGEVAEPFVDLDDLAEVATAALTGDLPAGRVYELTGPRLLTMSEVAAELTAAAGYPVSYSASTGAEFVADLAGDGIGPEDAEPLADLFATVLDGRNSSLLPDLEEALGRPATDFTDYARRAAASGVWTVAPVPAPLS